MESLFSRFEKLWRGEYSTHSEEHHPFRALNQIEEVDPDVAFYKGFVNLAVVKTEEGCVLLDSGSFHPVAHGRSFEKVRSWTGERIHTAIYTHGHVDHAYGLPPFLAEARAKGWARPSIVAHEAVEPRMQRYIETEGYNSVINERQFGVAIEWPTDPIVPTTSYRREMQLRIGNRLFSLHHARGETDDHTWIWVPDRRVLYTGDLFIWACPNAGNPQKVQRYAIEWAEALRLMAALKPAVLCPGHGLPVYGEEKVQSALLDTAEYLEVIYNQTVDMLNDGATVYDIIHSVQVPGHLEEKPYLQPVYDEPEFIARNVYRCLGGWYTGVPSELKPAGPDEQAREIASLAGGVDQLLARADALMQAGNLRMACHLADWAARVEPESRAVHQLRATVYARRTEAEPSTMSKGIFGAAHRESEEKAKG